MNIQNPDGMKPGEARCPGPSTKDIILEDKKPAPEPIVTECYEFKGDEDISYDRYIDQDFFDQEMEKMWSKVWQWACREEHIQEPGDFYVYDIGDYSFIVTRTDSGDIKAFYNSCLHRGTQLRPMGDEGSVANFRCPYHGWTWSLDGKLVDLPCEWDFPHVDKDAFALPEVQVDTWGGFVFINMDPDCKPLAEYLEVLPEHFKHYFPLERRYIETHIRRELPCNWKAAAEAFLEAYHVLETHPEGLPTSGDANAQYDIFGDHVNRFVHTIGYPSPHWQREMSQQDIVNAMIMGNADRGEDEIKVPDGAGAREILAQRNRDALGEKYGVDLNDRSDSEMLDSIEYFLFPNMFIFPGIPLPMIYRFRPNGTDVDSCWFDLLFLRPLPDGADHPEPPKAVKLGVDELYATVEGIDQGLAFVYEQDTSNMAAQQRGFKGSKKRGQTLGNYQEVRTRQVHATLDKYLKA